VETYSQTLCTWVGRKTDEWNGWGWCKENKYEIDVWKPGHKSQKSDVNKEEAIGGSVEY